MSKRNVLFIAIAVIVVGAGAAIAFWTYNSPEGKAGRMTIKNTTEEKAPNSEEPQPEQTLSPVQESLPTAKDDLEAVASKETDTVLSKPLPIIDTDTKKDNGLEITGDPLRLSEASRLPITAKLISWGFAESSNRAIDTIIVHSSYNALGGDKYDFDKLLAEYKEYGVAPHYLVDRKGKVYQLVIDRNIAYHAGESRTPDGRSNVNNFSIGIEIMTTKEEKPASEQYAALNSLITSLKTKYKIKYTLGHKDIAPGRKTDPWNFEWSKVKR